MSAKLRIALAQINTLVGDVPGNAQLVIDEACRLRDADAADLVVFPELTLTGYPPEDLLFHSGLRWRVEQAVERVREASEGIGILVGYPYYADARVIYNAASLFHNRGTEITYFKQKLPNYAVFDEKRYFQEGKEAALVDFKGLRLAVTICEDIWLPEPCAQAKALGADLMLNLNASPFSTKKNEMREDVLRKRAHESGLPIVYVNSVGGQDELVFDGSSMVTGGGGEVMVRAKPFEVHTPVVSISKDASSGLYFEGPIHPYPDSLERIYRAIVLGVRDYVNKHKFPGIVLGLSGGIDSALTLAIAVDALGADRVQAVMMPSRYTADMSKTDAALQCEMLGVDYQVISIEPMFNVALEALSEQFAGLEEDTTEENIQSRCRCMILMAISNKTGRMVLTTGNKSEMAVGYATLYGDMAGGFAPIKDCSKTRVFALARYRNTVSPAIPERVITRPPSAELRADQKDSDSLPPYDVLDPILKMFIENDSSVEQIVDAGFDREVVVRVLNMIKRNEYKRRQAPPGVRISKRAFGRDWRYPITSGY
ncbi:MAG: NAD+ synthase [Gammaproteobacteria bacterium]